MPLPSGSRLGPYEILAPLGAGGMGEVYRARDARLGRDVALKILPPAFASDPGRQARFEQEARAAAALNHPNIVGVFDFGTHEGALYIVSELVPGETLAALIERGPVPIRKLLEVAAQVADGISAAHAGRIAHRDLKPANIIISEDGRAKILDFGLARQASAAAAAPDATATIQQTSAGMILGTVNYMSPEQARGKEVDYRSDQFSFGLVLYEMAAGKRPFEREEAVQIMSAIIGEEPPPLDAKVPAPLRWAIDRCLAKDPRDRYESTRDLFRELRHLRDHLPEAAVAATGAVAPVAAPRRGRWKAAVAFAAGLLLAGAAATAFLLTRPRVADQSSYRFTPFSFESGGQCCAHWSADGKAVAYAAKRSPRDFKQVYLRYLDSPMPAQLTRTAEDDEVQSWAADGKHVLFTRDGVKPPGMWSVAAVGGEPEFAFAFPEVSTKASALSPDGRVYAVLREGPDQRFGIWFAAPPGSALKRYAPEPFATRAVYNNPQMAFSPDSKQILLYIARDKIREEAWIMPFPPDPGHPPRQILRTLPSEAGTPQFAWMPDNRHVILTFAPDLGAQQLWLADTRSETRYEITSGTESRSNPAVSPDGKRVLYTEGVSTSAIVNVDFHTAALTPLIATDRSQMMPAWAQKAPVMAYVTDRNGPQEIWLHASDGERPLIASAGNRWLIGPAPSPDGARIAYSEVDLASGATRLWIVAASRGTPIPLTNDSSGAEFPGSWSPDGAWFVYLRIHQGQVDVMKVKTSGEARPSVLKADIEPLRGGIPVWSPAGDWIAYDDKSEKLIAPDGSRSRDLNSAGFYAVGFSADSKSLYGVRDSKEKVLLYSVDIATGAERAIGDVGYNNQPASYSTPSLRLSLAPDGKSLTFGTVKYKSNLWMLEGFSK
jgi:Tol biopolymer transport system component